MNKRKGSSLNHFWSSAPFSLCYFFCWIGKLVLLKKLLTRLVSSEYHDLQRMEKAMALIRAFLVGAEQCIQWMAETNQAASLQRQRDNPRFRDWSVVAEVCFRWSNFKINSSFRSYVLHDVWNEKKIVKWLRTQLGWLGLGLHLWKECMRLYHGSPEEFGGLSSKQKFDECLKKFKSTCSPWPNMLDVPSNSQYKNMQF